MRFGRLFVARGARPSLLTAQIDVTASSKDNFVLAIITRSSLKLTPWVLEVLWWCVYAGTVPLASDAKFALAQG